MSAGYDAEQELWERAYGVLRGPDGLSYERLGWLLSALAQDAPAALAAALDRLERAYPPTPAAADPYAGLGLRCVHERDGTITTYGPTGRPDG